jgi:diadenosine tetraphosphate (Ap4A) HIT family hydrolase
MTSSATHNRPTAWTLADTLAGDTHPLVALPLCELRLMDDANYPWLILVPRVAEARELIDLDATQQARLMAEVSLASRVLQSLFRPHKLNVAALGNVVPQLHVHVIARQLDDPAWPKPVWGQVEARTYDPESLVRQVRALQASIAAQAA